MMQGETVLSSRVRLARNYADLPFDLTEKPEEAESCISRTVNALRSAGIADGELIRLSTLGGVKMRAMAEDRLISRDLLRSPKTAAVLLLPQVSVMMNEEDHLRIQACCPGLDLISAANAVFRVDDALSRQVNFAFDEELGYLTSCPTNTGTGMRASVLMHLPMLTKKKQMGNVGQIVAKVGLTLRGVYGEGVETLGDVYQVSNQVTLGRTEQEIMTTLTAVVHQLTEMETALRLTALDEDRVQTEDRIYRALGVMRYARRLNAKEFYACWSDVRLGVAMGLLKMPLQELDSLLDMTQEANLTLRSADEDDLLAARAECVRACIGTQPGMC